MSIVVVISSATGSHATSSLPKALKQFERILEKTDPETLFLAFKDKGDLSHLNFKKSYTNFINYLKKDPKRIHHIEWHRIVPLLRGIIAHARYNENLSQMISSLPAHVLCPVLLHNMYIVCMKAKKLFDDKIACVERPELSNIMEYLRMENDAVIAGSIMLFVCYAYKEFFGVNDDITASESIATATIEEARLRIRIMLTKQSVFNTDLFLALVEKANDEASPYYHIGSRYNVVGLIIAEVHESHLAIQHEIANPETNCMAD